MSGPRPRWFLLGIGVVILTVAGGEIVARVIAFRWLPFSLGDSAGVFWYTPDGLGDFQPSKNSVYDPSPLSEDPGPRPYSFRTNSQGLRAAWEYAVPKPAGITRILCIGDSFTEGALVHNFDTYPALLGSRVLKLQDGFEVINAGRSAYGILEELDYLLEKGFRPQPDVVILQVLNNDLFDLHMQVEGKRGVVRPPTKRSWAINRVAYWGIWNSALVRLAFWQIWRSQWHSTLDRERTERALAAQGEYFDFIYRNSDPSGLTATQKVYEESFRLFRDALVKASVRMVVVHPPDYMQVTGDLPDHPQKFFRELSARYGVPYVDLLPVFRSYSVEPDFIYMMPQNGHLSRLGNWVMAREVGRVVVALLSKSVLPPQLMYRATSQ